MPQQKPDRLFVPLASEPYRWFESGRKRWELRLYGRQYTETHVRPRRRVELRRGYSDAGQALWGVILEVELAATVDAFFDRVPFEEVVPIATSRDHAVALVEEILGLGDGASQPLLGFKIELEI